LTRIAKALCGEIEAGRERKERQRVPLLTTPVVLDTLSIWFHPNTVFDPLSRLADFEVKCCCFLCDTQIYASVTSAALVEIHKQARRSQCWRSVITPP